MGIARCICLTNAKLAIKAKERANRLIAELCSLFLLFSLELGGLRRYEFAFGFAKRKRYDMIALVSS